MSKCHFIHFLFHQYGLPAASYGNVNIQSLHDHELLYSQFKRGFVKAAVSRAVRLRECPLRELRLIKSDLVSSSSVGRLLSLLRVPDHFPSISLV